MKTASAALTTLLNASGGATPLIAFDLYTFSLIGGGFLYYTTADFPITAADATIWQAPNVQAAGGNLWFSGIVWQPFLIDSESSKSTGKWGVGLDSDQWTVKIAPRAADAQGNAFPDLIGSTPWLQAAAFGLLKFADVIVSRAYFAAMPTWPLPPAGSNPVGTIHIFRGIVGEISLTTTAAYLKINDYKSLLSLQMPRNIYQASCRHRVFDNRCTLLASAYTSGALHVQTGSTQTTVIGGATPNPSGFGTFNLGVLTFTSGQNAGILRVIRQWNGHGVFSLLNPLPFTPAVGDTFTVAPGCDKTTTTCAAVGNLANFGGDPFIPMPEVTLG